MSLNKPFEFSRVLGGSSTRYDLFSICKRRYYYQYYTKYDTEFPVRDIEQLKELVSVPLAIGEVAHGVIKVLLNRLQKTPGELDEGRFFDFALRTAEHATRSKQFEEVYYGAAEQIRPDDIFPKVGQGLENLLSSERYRWIASEAAVSSDRWIIDPPGYGETRLAGLKAYCKVDFLFPVGDVYCILDWKTGKPDPDKHRKQLIGYSAWTSFEFDAEPERVTPTIAYLNPSYAEVNETFNSFDLEGLAVQVLAETDAMYEYCRDVGQNVPLDKSEFPIADNARICAFCKFRRLCSPDRYARAEAATCRCACSSSLVPSTSPTCTE